MQVMARKTCSWGHPALKKADVVAVAENLIPKRLRPYYTGIDVMKHTLSEPWTEWNCDIVLFFKYPVAGCICDDARYAHGNLVTIQEQLADLYIDEDSRYEELEDYDSEHDNLPVKPIKPIDNDIDWHVAGYDGLD